MLTVESQLPWRNWRANQGSRPLPHIIPLRTSLLAEGVMTSKTWRLTPPRFGTFDTPARPPPRTQEPHRHVAMCSPNAPRRPPISSTLPLRGIRIHQWRNECRTSRDLPETRMGRRRSTGDGEGTSRFRAKMPSISGRPIAPRGDNHLSPRRSFSYAAPPVSPYVRGPLHLASVVLSQWRRGWRTNNSRSCS